MKERVYRHLGHNHFDPVMFMPVSNERGWIKPRGGLWSSPIDTGNGWEDWIEANNYERAKYDDESFDFKLKPNAKVLYITNAEQLNELPQVDTDSNYITWTVLDFEALAKEYDAMEVLISSDNQLYWDLYGWDCDTLLVFNPDVVEEIK